MYQVYGPKNPVAEMKAEKKKLPIKKVDWEKNVYEDPFFLSLKERMPSELTIGDVGNKEPFIKKR